MADSAIDGQWEVVIAAKMCVYPENVLDEKWYSFVLEVWLGKVHVENEGRFQALPPVAYFVRVRFDRSIQRLLGR